MCFDVKLMYDTVGGPNDIPYWFFMCKNLAVIFDIIGFSSLSLAQTIDHRGNFWLLKPLSAVADQN